MGISAILATSALAFAVVKYVAAAYLSYLGIRALRSAGSGLPLESSRTASTTRWQAYRQGVLVDILNPKAAIFFMAFFPQFVRSDGGAVAMQLLILGVLVVLMAIIIECTLTLLAARARSVLRANRRMSQWLDRLLGVVLISLEIRLCLAERS